MALHSWQYHRIENSAMNKVARFVPESLSIGNFFKNSLLFYCAKLSLKLYLFRNLGVCVLLSSANRRGYWPMNVFNESQCQWYYG